MARAPAGGRTATAGRLAFIDTLRFVAALAVVLQHLLERQHNRVFDVFVWLGPGVFGVALFFIISGFVIPFSVKRGFDPADFAVRRIFRIYPLVLAAFACAWAGQKAGLLPDYRAIAEGGPAQWAANLLLVFDFVDTPAFHGVMWTLPIEFAWYALFAVSLMLFHRRAGTVLEIGAPILFVALALGSLGAGYRLPLGRVGLFYAAVIGFQCCRHFEGLIPTRRLAIDAALFLVIMAFGNVIAFGHFHHPRITMMQAVGPWFIASAIFFLVYAVPRVREARVLTNPIVAGLGAISFSTYLLHPFALSLAAHFLKSGAVMNVAALALTLLFSIMGYRFVELPGIALGKRLSRWLCARAAAWPRSASA